MVETANAWTLDENAGHQRESARPKHLRQAGFEELFDARTVFYDCFRISPARVLLLGPPLVQFAGVLDTLTIHALPGRKECRFHVEHRFTTAFGNRQTHNGCRVFVDAPEGVTSLDLRCAAGECVLPIAEAGSEGFHGKRVLLTLSRNNDPVWICDWMRFHRDLQQADAVLLYDNGSTAYKAAELLEAMSRVSGFATVSVVEWPFKYGPQGMGRGTWDSAFCQDGALEDARWRFLGQAYAVLSCDIDELTVTSKENIFDRAANSASGYVKFAGRWVNPPRQTGNGHRHDVSGELPRHSDSTHQLLPRWRWRGFKLRDLHLSPPKWAVVPSRCPQDAHWSVHEIVGMDARVENVNEACYRHFQKISTNWKKTRANSEAVKGAAYKVDGALEGAFQKVRWAE